MRAAPAVAGGGARRPNRSRGRPPPQHAESPRRQDGAAPGPRCGPACLGGWSGGPGIGGAHGARAATHHTVRRARPLLRRLARIDRPARVRMRKRNPCFLCRRRLFGWYVRFMTSPSRNAGRTNSPHRQPPFVTVGSRQGPPRQAYVTGPRPRHGPGAYTSRRHAAPGRHADPAKKITDELWTIGCNPGADSISVIARRTPLPRRETPDSLSTSVIHTVENLCPTYRSHTWT